MFVSIFPSSDPRTTVSIGPPYLRLRIGLVLVGDPSYLFVWGGDEADVELPRMPKDAPFRVVTDAAHDRVYAISSAGLVATIDHFSSPKIAYHRVSLNGKPFEAARAGSGRIALWGEDGLGTIDVRTWKTNAIAPGVSGALATRYGIAAWTETTDGLRVYKADGTRRFQRLQGQQITAATAVGPYLYADTTANTRYAIDLRTGRTTAPLATNARIVTPSYVVIP